MKISSLERGAKCRVPGIELELEVLEHSASSTRVRPTERTAVILQDRHGEEVRILSRPPAFSISHGTEVEVLS